MPKVKRSNYYGERYSVYDTTTSEEKSKSTNDKIQILSAMEVNEPYQHAVIICERG